MMYVYFVILTGPTLFAASTLGAMGSLELELKPCLVFSAIIVAVDPVAVRTIETSSLTLIQLINCPPHDLTNGLARTLLSIGKWINSAVYCVSILTI